MVGLFHVTRFAEQYGQRFTPLRDPVTEKKHVLEIIDTVAKFIIEIYDATVKNGADHFNHKTLHEVFPVQGIIAVAVPDHQHDHI